MLFLEGLWRLKNRLFEKPVYGIKNAVYNISFDGHNAMKYIIAICAICLITLVACKRQPENASVVKMTGNESNLSAETKSVESSMEKPAMPKDELKWGYYFREKKDPAALAVYSEAEKLVRELRTYKSELDSGSHLGTWYILNYPDPPRTEPVPYDEGGPMRDAFIVDMASRKAIRRGDWAAAAPFFISLALAEDRDQKALSAPERCVSDIKLDKDFSPNMIASFASLVAFGHQLYWHDPEAEKTAEGAIVVKYDVPPQGSSAIAKHCRLTITDDSVGFECEDYMI